MRAGLISGIVFGMSLVATGRPGFGQELVQVPEGNLAKNPRNLASEPEPGKEYKFDLSNAPVIGDPQARVKVVIFSDFLCPYCSRMAETLEVLQREHPGDLVIFYKNFVVHKTALIEHEAAMSADSQGKFQALHDLLFENQPELAELSYQGEEQLRDKIMSLAEAAGLDLEQLKADLESHKYQNLVKEHMKEGRAAGVSGTPSVFINGYFYGYDPDTIRERLNQELNQKPD